MSRTTMTAAFAAMLAASMPIAFAQTTITTTPPSVTGPKVETTVPVDRPASRLLPGQVRFTEMNGATVYDTQNKNLGDIKDVVVDREGRIGAVVLDVGSFLGMGGKYVAVSLDDVKITTDNGKLHFSVDMTKDQLKSAQAYDLNPKTESTGTSTAPAYPAKK